MQAVRKDYCKLVHGCRALISREDRNLAQERLFDKSRQAPCQALEHPLTAGGTNQRSVHPTQERTPSRLTDPEEAMKRPGVPANRPTCVGVL